jgi:hypothetical protein
LLSPLFPPLFGRKGGLDNPGNAPPSSLQKDATRLFNLSSGIRKGPTPFWEVIRPFREAVFMDTVVLKDNEMSA